MLVQKFEFHSWRKTDHECYGRQFRVANHLGLQTEILSKAITEVNSFFTSPSGFFALITDPKVVVVTETINSKEKIKLRWSMFNLENNNKNTEHSLFPMTSSSTAERCFNNDFG